MIIMLINGINKEPETTDWVENVLGGFKAPFTLEFWSGPPKIFWAITEQKAHLSL